ncbi:MAG: hypothetical protein AB7F86_12645 [Bdellovibrionales bacterium]
MKFTLAMLSIFIGSLSFAETGKSPKRAPAQVLSDIEYTKGAENIVKAARRMFKADEQPGETVQYMSRIQSRTQSFMVVKVTAVTTWKPSGQLTCDYLVEFSTLSPLSLKLPYGSCY